MFAPADRAEFRDALVSYAHDDPNIVGAALFALACARHGLNAWHGREIDRLPAAELSALRASRATDVTAAAIDESKRLLLEQFQTEVERHDHSRAARLREPLTAMR